LYISQKVHLFHGQFSVILSSSDALPPSLGGRYNPIAKDEFAIIAALLLYVSFSDENDMSIPYQLDLSSNLVG